MHVLSPLLIGVLIILQGNYTDIFVGGPKFKAFYEFMVFAKSECM